MALRISTADVIHKLYYRKRWQNDDEWRAGYERRRWNLFEGTIPALTWEILRKTNVSFRQTVGGMWLAPAVTKCTSPAQQLLRNM
jgi:hypothetical protein